MAAAWPRAILLVAGLTGCRAVLGIEDGQPLPDAGASDATADVTPSDAPPPDASGDANPCGADLTTDPLNCGYCGHDCLGGACSGAKCQPLTYSVGIEGTETVLDFAIDPSFIYYLFVSNTADHSVMKIPLAGGTPVMVADLGSEVGTDLFVDTASAYWISQDTTNHPQLRKAPLAGGTPATVAGPLGTSPSSILSVTTDGTWMYWSDPSGAGTVSRVALSGGSPSVIVSGEAIASTGLVAVDATSIYWNTSAPAIRKAPLTGGTPILVASGIGGIAATQAMTVDTTSVYWDYGGIWKVPTQGGVPAAILGGSSTGHMVIDTSSVFWEDSGEIRTGALTGGAAATLTTSPALQTKRGLAVDAVAVYWAQGDASIHRVAK